MSRLFVACLLTVGIESAFFFLLGFRERRFLLLCACANTATNLSLNLLLLLLYHVGADLTVAVYPLEAAVVLCEFLIFRAYLGPSRPLFWLVLAANALSYGLGLLLYGHV